MTDIYTVKMPDIGEGVAEGEVISWLKKVDEPIKQDEPVIVVMTDKATVELPAPYPGILVKQYYKAGEMAIKGKPLYDIGLSSTGIINKTKTIENECVKKEKAKGKEKNKAKEKVSDKEKEQNDLAKEIESEIKTPKQEKALAIPAIRKMAKELGLDINLVSGSGSNGRVTQEDLKAYLKTNLISSETQKSPNENESLIRTNKRAAPYISTCTPPHRFEDDEEIPILGLRNIISEKMVESKLIIPHFSYSDHLDATRLVQLRENMKDEVLANGIKLTFMPFFIRALSLSLIKHPSFNGSIDLTEKKLIIHKQQHMGLAIKTPMGLMAPVLHNVHKMTLYDIIQSFDALKNKALSGKIEPSDMKDSTITISNFGVLGGLWATPIINYPEIAILGVAKIRKEPVVKNDAIVIRSMLNLSWSFDHRVIDGDTAAEFSNYFISLLENPARLL